MFSVIPLSAGRLEVDAPQDSGQLSSFYVTSSARGDTLGPPQWELSCLNSEHPGLCPGPDVCPELPTCRANCLLDFTTPNTSSKLNPNPIPKHSNLTVFCFLIRK